MIVVRFGAWSYAAPKASQEAGPLGNTIMVAFARHEAQVEIGCIFAQK